MSTRDGGAAQSSFVPAPEGTTARPVPVTSSSTALTASGEAGAATQLAGTPLTVSTTPPGRAYPSPQIRRSSARVVGTAPLPTIRTYVRNPTWLLDPSASEPHSRHR